jgi:hypothetical protein
MSANTDLTTKASKYINSGLNYSKDQKTADAAGAAGYTMLCIFNFCLLIILSHEGLGDGSATKVAASDMDVIPMNPV